MASVTWVTAEDVTPSDTTGWQEVDTATIPDGATGAIIQIINDNTANTDFRTGLRRADSTDTRIELQHEESHEWAIIGVDSTGKFDAYRNDTEIKYWLHGYLEDGFTNKQNSVDHTPGTAGSFQNVDITASTTGDATVGVFEFDGLANQTTGAQHPDSTDDATHTWRQHAWNMVGLNSSEQCEWYLESVSTDAIWLVGYFTANVTMLTDWVDRTADVTDEMWAALTALDSSAVGGIYKALQYDEDILDEYYGIRAKGGSRDVQWCGGALEFAMALSDVDSGQQVEWWGETGGSFNTAIVFEAGYFTAAAAASVSLVTAPYTAT